MDDLTAAMISRSRIIAKGQRIRDLRRLLETYGGVASRWTKKSSPPFESEGGIYEFHWYEHEGLGRFEVKRKEVKEP